MLLAILSVVLGPNVPIESFPSSLIEVDDDGLEWVAGTCKCEFPLPKVIPDIVIEAL